MERFYYIYGKLECEGILAESEQDVVAMLEKRYGSVDLSKLAFISEQLYNIISAYGQEKYEEGYASCNEEWDCLQ